MDSVTNLQNGPLYRLQNIAFKFRKYKRSKAKFESKKAIQLQTRKRRETSSNLDFVLRTSVRFRTLKLTTSSIFVTTFIYENFKNIVANIFGTSFNKCISSQKRHQRWFTVNHRTISPLMLATYIKYHERFINVRH